MLEHVAGVGRDMRERAPLADPRGNAELSRSRSRYAWGLGGAAAVDSAPHSIDRTAFCRRLRKLTLFFAVGTVTSHVAPVHAPLATGAGRHHA